MADPADAHHLSATAKVILGLLAKKPRSGYEIKSLVDDSTAYFWAASYGQIYPELKRLSERGLVKGTDEPTGGRKRTVWEITEQGRAALREWFDRPAEVYELRDEGMLKVFLAGSIDRKGAAGAARERARHATEVAERLREVESRAEGKDLPAYEVLLSGIAFQDFIADHYEKAARRLEKED